MDGMQPLATPPDAILFDWDGTLSDSIALVTAATNEVLARHGFDLLGEDAIHDGMQHPTAERFAYHLGWEMSEPEHAARAAQIADEFYAAADRLGHIYTKLYPGVREMLDEIVSRGLPMGIVTNNRNGVIVALLRHLKLDRHFPVVIAEENVALPKPDPEGVRIAAGLLGASVERTVFVGDSRSDAEAAANAGAIGIGIAWQAASIVHTRPGTYEHVIELPSDLIDALPDPEVVRE